MRTTNKTILLLSVCALGLSACGDNPGDRAGTGAMIGGAGGAILGAAVAGDPWAGAAVGGALGAGAGAVIGHETTKHDINFGSAPW